MSSDLVIHADPDADARWLVQTTLANEGLRVLSAPTATKALKLCENEHPVLAILETQMPSVAGLEVGRMLSTEMNIPVVFVVSRSDDPTLEAVTEAATITCVTSSGAC